jgi:hypothetical protein
MKALTNQLLRRYSAACLTAALSVLLPLSAAQAADGLKIEIISAYNLVVDSNITTPATYAPGAATVGAKICNTTDAAINDVQVYIGDYAAGTPGEYPVFDSAGDSRAWLAGTGEYSLKQESGSYSSVSDASRAWVGTILPGECKVEYWVISYPQCVNVGGLPQSPPCTASITGASTVADDLTLHYDVWATGSGVTTAHDSQGLTLRSELSASANKIWPNGDNKVPAEYKAAIEEAFGWDVWTPTGGTAYPGQTIRTQGIWYDLGNVVQGFDNNGDGVPDQNAWLQPVGDPSVYDPGCFRLVRTYGIIVVKLKTGGELLIPFENEMYFQNIPDNTGVVGLVFYEYAALNGACTGTLTPYQEVASGYLNEKFNGDYGTGFQLQTQEPLASIEKGGELSGSVVTYTLEITNPDTYKDGSGDPLTVAVGDPSLGIPLVIREKIPEGVEYAAGTAGFIANESGVMKNGVILYSTDNGNSWSAVEPSPAASVTNIEWRLNEPLTSDSSAGQNTMKVEFKVNLPSSYDKPYVSNIGCAAFGAAPCFDTDDDLILLPGTATLTGTVFGDNGSGSLNGNGVQDSEEDGITGVPVTLYYDADGSGTYTPGDLLWGTTTTDSGGTYSFDELPAGNWVAVVGTPPGDFSSWASTTGAVHSVTLAAGESGTAAPTGFAPALTLDKDIIISGSRIDDETVSPLPSIKEGDSVSYAIDLKNNLYGEGGSSACIRERWATALVTGSNPWTNPDLAIDSPRNGTGATAPFSNNPDVLSLTTFPLANGQSGAISTLDIVIPLMKTVLFTGDGNNETITVRVVNQAGVTVIDGATNPKYIFGPYNLPVSDASCTVTCSGDLVISNVLADLPVAPTLAELASYRIVIVSSKGGPTPAGKLLVDSAGFRVTTAGSCDANSTIINPAPLFDTFDSSKLQFVSASPAQNRVVCPDGGPICRIEWDNLGPLYPSETKQVTVNFIALEPASTPMTVANTAEVKNALFASGTPANNADDSVTTGLNATAAIGSAVWYDADGDGVRDEGEPGIPGVDVYLCTSTNPCAAGAADAVKVTTDANGNYQFDGLIDGTYYVTVDSSTLPADFTTTPTADPDAVKNGQSSVTISGGADNMDQNWGYTAGPATPGIIVGSIWQDFDGDKSRDENDTPFAGWTVTLYKSDGTVAGTATTNADGTYSFGDLPNGSYYTTVTPPAGYTQTHDYSGALDNNSGPITISDSNKIVANVDFAYQAGTNSIGDRLYLDLNGDGDDEDGKDSGIANVTVNLYQDTINGLVLLGSAVTDANGAYLFENLPDGDYVVMVDKNDPDFPPSAVQTGDPNETGVCAVCDSAAPVTVNGGEDLRDIDFGYKPVGGSIGDSIFWDVNGDGSQGTNEPGIAGVTVELYTFTDSNNNHRWDIGEPISATSYATTTTDANGNYMFSGLPDGNYLVDVGNGTGTSPLTSDPNLDGAACPASGQPLCDGKYGVEINGNTFMGADFGYKPPVVVSGQLFVDTNFDPLNPQRQTSDTSLAYVPVVLQDCGSDGVCGNSDDGPALTTFTDENGNYSFVNPPEGNYRVFIDPANLPGYIDDTYRYNGHAADSFDDNYSLVTVTAGSQITDVDFGYKYEDISSLSGTVCLETNSDGVCGSGDSGVGAGESAYSGVPVYVSKWTDLDNDGEIDPGELTALAQTVTGANGDYSFTGLPSVSEPDPCAAGETPPDQCSYSESYVVSLAAPASYLDLTTELDDTPADHLFENTSGGYTTSVMQVISNDGTTTGLDFAFQQAVQYDFGDLPLPFETALGIDGARHIVPATKNLYLGADVTTEADGIPSVGATSDADDGVVKVGEWTVGSPADKDGDGNPTPHGGTISVTTYGKGWFIGWIDFNGDGSFSGPGEMIVSQELGTAGDTVVTEIPFDIPANGLSSPGYARFRFFPSQPPVPLLAFKGIATNGEVEDYWYNLSPSGSIGDRIWLDFNGDGVQNADEPGIANVTVELRNEFCNAGVDCPTAVTGPDGSYIFPGVGAGTYTVAVVTSTLPAGLAATYDKDGGLNGTTEVTLAAGEMLTDIDFGYKWSGAGGVIGDRIWNDADGNGVQDPGEAGIGGVVVALKDGSGNPILDSNGNPVTATTAPDGSYSFPSLPQGNYTVEVTPPAGTELTGDPDELGSACSVCDSKTTTPIVITSAGDVIMTADFGFQYPESATSDIGDKIYRSDGGAGIEGVTVVLKDSDGKIIAQTVTDANGEYLFPDLPPGTYTVVVTDTAGNLAELIQTFDKDGVLDNSHTVTTTGGADYLDADFGYGPPKPTYAAVSGFAAYVGEDGETVLEWRTASEIGTVGFVLERLNRQRGEYEPVSEEMLPGVLDPPHGGVYRLADPAAAPGSEQTYQVVEITAQGTGTVSGPHTVKAELSLPSAPGMAERGPEGFSSAYQATGRNELRRAAVRKAALRSAAAAPKKPQAVVRTLKIPVRQDGLVHLTADELAAASGMKRNQIVPLLKARKALVTLEGRRIPVLPAANGAGLWFYGQAPSRRDLAENTYRLELGKLGAALANAPAQRTGRLTFSGKSFTDQIRLEENHRALHFYNISKPLRDLWAWTYLYASGGKPASFTQTFDAPDMADGAVALTAHLVNTSFRSRGAAAPYKIALFLNEEEIGAAESAEQGDWRIRAEIPRGLLRESGNEVKITALLNSGVSYSLIHLDSIEIERQRLYQAEGGGLAFSSGGNSSVTVEGFSGGAVLALDITSPEKPLRAKAAVSKKKGADGLHSVTVQTRPNRRYLVTENLNAAAADGLTADMPSQLRNVKNQADYLIIAPAGLLESARRLAEHRESQGLKTMLADIEDVRDEFSASQAAPEAVHAFLAHAHAKWAQAPRYVALIGDGSFDYRDHLGFGKPQTPAELVMTPDGAFPSDNALGDVAEEDGVPEFAVGRIPVFDKAELERYIDKVVAYEQAPPATAAVFVNDRPDPAAGNFKASADKAAALMPEHMELIRLDVASAAKYAEARNKTFGAMQNGAAVVHYVGHSSVTALGSGIVQLLQAAQIDALNPPGQPLLMVSMSCSAGFFGYPAMNSFGETALLKAGGGAAAFFGSSGLSYNHLADIMTEGLYKGLADPANPRIGDAAVHAKRHYADKKQGRDAFMLDIYNLIGDPALLTPARQ